MGLPEPFKYQVWGREKAAHLRRTCIVAPPGAGKTRIAIESLMDVDGFNGPVLILCTGPAVATWTRQVPLWSQIPSIEENIWNTGGTSPKVRASLWKQAKEEGGIYITNSQLFLRDYAKIQQVPWTTVISDEYHKFMRRRTSQTYTKFLRLTRHLDNVVLTTGSPFRRDPSSMFTAFQIINPRVFSSYWRYVRAHCWIDETPFGKRAVGVRQPAKFRNLMDQWMVYIPDEVVRDSLPQGRRYGIDTAMSNEQQRIYYQLEDDMIAEAGDSLVVTPTVLGRLIKQRQLLCCPRILDPALGMGSGFEAILDRIEDDPHAVIFVPFRDACDYIAAELSKKYTVGIIRGGVTTEEQTEIIQRFRDEGGIIVCTIQYAESFDLETCKTSYFLGYDLTVDQNEQAEGRTRRASSEHGFVSWGYVKYDAPIDQYFLAKLDDDSRNAHLVLQRPEEYIRMLLQESRDEVDLAP